MNSSTLSIAGFQALVDQWIRTVGNGYFSPLTNMAILTEEVGEVARIMAREHGEQSWRTGADHPDLADELADVMWVVAAIANQTGVDLNEAVSRNVDKKTGRDGRRHASNPKLNKQ
ncbi:MAG: nucleotide pyrophosphohydrolase [Firmicutes bacterium]|nr:nucleotide pyrophosphohydrolase [Bacillota bacterium]MCM1400607.1 nucleotide pyrophosphohydrolase [Bacteroides sp.]MCM1476318.1 nucleotide pyrophosphohydrolase [Bacteroides sp.]